MPTEDHISALERLAKLKAEGAISEGDFEAQKARLMDAKDGPSVQPPPDSPSRPKRTKLILGAVAGIWAVALLAKAIFHPGEWGTEPQEVAKTPAAAPASSSPARTTPPADKSNQASMGQLGGAQSPEQCEQPVIAKRTPYLTARAKLLAAGYSPVKATPEAGSYCDDSDHAATCQKLPEIDDCSADGYCKMAFQSVGHTSAIVITFGDGPEGNDTTVQNVTYKCGERPALSTQATSVQTTPSTGPAAVGAEGSLSTYTNARYSYSARYRTDLLNIGPEAPSGDGVTLHSRDQSAVVRLFAEYNTLNQTPKAIEKDAAKHCVNPSAITAQADPTLVNVICEVSGGTVHFTRVIIRDDLLVTMDATYPKADQLIWNPVMGRMSISMKVGQ